VQTNNNINGVKIVALQQPFVSIYTIFRPSNPFAYSEKTDIQWQLVTSTGTIAAGIIITGKLIQNNNNVTGVGT
jgi:hypothetical protein